MVRAVVPPASTSRPRLGEATKFRLPGTADGRAMWSLADRSGLDLNSPYAYVMWAEYHAGTSIVATDTDGDLAGFVIGFRVPGRPGTVFVWQIAVDERQRGRGVGGQMLDELVARTGAATVEATVTPDNEASAALFRGLAARHGTTAEEELVFAADLFPGGHDPEIRFRIPVRPPGAPSASSTTTTTEIPRD